MAITNINGKLFRMKIGTYLVTASTDCEYSIEQDDPKTTTQDSGGFETSLDSGGIIRASGSVNGLLDVDGNYNAEELIDQILTRATMPTAQYGVVGGIAYSSKVKINNVKVSGSNETAVGISFSWVSSGAITKVTAMTS